MDENAFLKSIFPLLKQGDDIAVGPGDDCAVIDVGFKDKLMLIAADQIISNVHFDPAIARPEEAGAKLLKRNISDIAAMGGKPAHAVLTVASCGFDNEYLYRFYKGLAEVADQHGISVCGGDIASLQGGLVNSEKLKVKNEKADRECSVSTATQHLNISTNKQINKSPHSKSKIQNQQSEIFPFSQNISKIPNLKSEIQNSKSNPTFSHLTSNTQHSTSLTPSSHFPINPPLQPQLLVTTLTITGYVEKENLCLRSSAKSGEIVFVTGEFGNSYNSKHHLSFTPRVEEGSYVAGKYTSTMMDVSDGLLIDLQRIAKASDVTICLDCDVIPLRDDVSEVKNALTDGEDYELIFTVPEDIAQELIQIWPFKTKLTPIGRILQKIENLDVVEDVTSELQVTKFELRSEDSSTPQQINTSTNKQITSFPNSIFNIQHSTSLPLSPHLRFNSSSNLPISPSTQYIDLIKKYSKTGWDHLSDKNKE